jgi:hypothetical protein
MAVESLAHLPLNCPRCGRAMRYVLARSADGQTLPNAEATASSIYIYQRAEHGPFRFSLDILLQPGA